MCPKSSCLFKHFWILFVLHKRERGEKQKVKSTHQSNQTSRQYGRLQPVILPTVSSTMFHTDHAAILEVNLEVRITQRANLCKHWYNEFAFRLNYALLVFDVCSQVLLSTAQIKVKQLYLAQLLKNYIQCDRVQIIPMLTSPEHGTMYYSNAFL